MSEKITIGRYAQELIAQGLENDEILERIAAAFPGSKTTKACLAWYRNKMRKAGTLGAYTPKPVMTDEERRQARNEASKRCRAKKESEIEALKRQIAELEAKLNG